MLNGTLFITTMCQFFGKALINHVLEVFITRIDGIKQDLSLYKATADFKHTKNEAVWSNYGCENHSEAVLSCGLRNPLW